MITAHTGIWRTAGLTAALLAAIVAVFLAANSPAHAEDESVSIIDLAYQPSLVTVDVGDSVTWTNDGAVAHTVTSDTGSEMNSGNINPGGMYVNQFNSPGTFTYHCEIHPAMQGTVVVEEQEPGTPTTPETPTTATTTTTATVTETVTTTVTASATAGTATATATQTPTQTATLTPTATATRTNTPTTFPGTLTPTATGTGVVSPASPTPGAPDTGAGMFGGGTPVGVILMALGAMVIIAGAGSALALRGSLKR